MADLGVMELCNGRLGSSLSPLIDRRIALTTVMSAILAATDGDVGGSCAQQDDTGGKTHLHDGNATMATAGDSRTESAEGSTPRLPRPVTPSSLVLLHSCGGPENCTNVTPPDRWSLPLLSAFCLEPMTRGCRAICRVDGGSVARTVDWWTQATGEKC